jgi:alpha-tubulin suppressor-like RCC1 family protein
MISRNFLPTYKITKIACGAAHCLAITHKGVAFSWGNSDNGRLGQGKTGHIDHPQLVFLTFSRYSFSA